MKKQSAFTLIELMVVMAIIAILATAGLSAYTGYLKKARDTTRIADISAMNTVVISALSSTGSLPADITAAVTAANNGQMLTDPLANIFTCFVNDFSDDIAPCGYGYHLCDNGAGYLLTARFESKSNLGNYTTYPSVGSYPTTGYNVGSCTQLDLGTVASDSGTCLYNSDCSQGNVNCQYTACSSG